MYRLLLHVLQPAFLLFLILAIAIALLWRKRRETRGRLLWVTVPFVLLAILSTHAIGHLALGTLEWRYPPSAEIPEDTEAIVVLAGHVRAPDATRPKAELGAETMYRCLQAARLYHKTKGIPVVVSGGRPEGVRPGPPYAEVMREFLIEQGVKDAHLIVEKDSKNTYENAVQCCKLLEHRGLRRIVLVTDALHMYRSVLCFRKQGIDPIPSACNHMATEFEARPEDFLPSGSAGVEKAVHEWLGTAYYWARGRA